MKCYKTFMLFSFLFISWTSVVNGQEIRDILKEQLRKSLITPETPMQRQPYQIEQQRHQGDVLKVSPFTKLPTKFDRIITMSKEEGVATNILNFPNKMKIIPTNSSPINMRLIGSTQVLIGKPKDIHTNPAIHPAPGMLVKPSGISFDPTYAREARRRERTDRLVKAYNNDW